MADTAKHFVGGPVGRELTDDEAYQLGLMLFDAINAERQASGSDDASDATDAGTNSDTDAPQNQ